MAEVVKHTYGTINVETAGRWFTLAPEDDGPIWMINLMKYKPTAAYDATADVPEATRDITGKAADDAYNPVPVLDRLGAVVAFHGDVLSQTDGTPVWDRIGIVRYPTRMSFLTMEQREDFKEIHVHKKAGMDFTILVGGLPEFSNGDLAVESDSYVMRVRRFTQGATQGAEHPGVTPVVVFRSDGTILGDERVWDEVRFDLVTADAMEHLNDVDGVEEQFTMVVHRAIDNLVSSIATA